MDLERQNPQTPAPGLPFPAKIAIGALALWGTFTVLQWFVLSALRFVRFGLFVVIVIALFSWAVSAKSNR